MNAPLIVEDLVRSLQRRYGKAESFGRSRLFTFGSSFSCSVNYSKTLPGPRYFFGVSREVVDPDFQYPTTDAGDFALLICGSTENTLTLPRTLIIEMLADVPTRRIDISYEDGTYILQTTQHPKLNVSEFLNSFPKKMTDAGQLSDHADNQSRDRIHSKIQWSLIQLGRAEGCTVWVPPNDRNLSFERQSFTELTLPKLPNFGFDENTRRIVQNIDVLWLSRNVIRKAFEVESTTSVYSGLLRLNDLVLAQPNNLIDLYIVAAGSKRDRVHNQLIRPSFQSLINKCEFISFSSIDEQIKRLTSLSLHKGARVSGLIQGERFALPEHYIYPSGV